MSAAVRVFVVDDQVSFRQAAAAVVEATDGFELVGEAADAAQALTALVERAEDVDLVLVDVNLGDDDGVELTRTLTAARRGLVVVLVSTFDESSLPGDLAGCGAKMFIPKIAFGPAALKALRPTR